MKLSERLTICLLFVSLLVPVFPARAQNVAAAGPARGEAAHNKGDISGRVVDESGQPVADAFIFAFALGRRQNNENATADRNGKFNIGNLPPGAYRLNVISPGYVFEPDSPMDPPTARKFYRPGDTATLRLIKGGVLTGRVTDAGGEPIVGVHVRAVRVRLPDGRPVSAGDERQLFRPPAERTTDDRGVYRLYGVAPGAYIISAGGKGLNSLQPAAYDADAPTFYPSTTRDDATEVPLQGGQEVTDLDIRYRGERGRVVSGTLTAAGAAPAVDPAGGFVRLQLLRTATGAEELTTFLNGGRLGFSFEGVADGDYDIVAYGSSSRSEDGTTGALRRIAVRGADVTGLKLMLKPSAAVAGRVVFETPKGTNPASCRPSRALRPEEIVVFARRAGKDTAEGSPGQTPAPTPREGQSAPDATGEFTIRNLDAANYRFEVALPGEDYYLSAFTLPSAAAVAVPPKAVAVAPPRAIVAPARQALSLAEGERFNHLTIMIAAFGAAAVRGRLLIAEPEGTQATDFHRRRVHLVPADPRHAEDVLRYAEVAVNGDGSFAFTNLAPGSYYWLYTNGAAGNGLAPSLTHPLAWDTAARSLLRREAETRKNLVELQPCQRVEGFVLRLPAP